MAANTPEAVPQSTCPSSQPNGRRTNQKVPPKISRLYLVAPAPTIMPPMTVLAMEKGVESRL